MFETARPFLLALAIGLLVGIERERAHSDRRVHEPLGSRSFALLGLLGALAGYLSDPVMAGFLAAFAGVVVLAGYLRTQLGPEGSGVGVTTELAAGVTFTLGFLAHRQALLAVMLGVIVLVLLSLKPRIHHFARAGLKETEVSAALTFMVIAFVVLPLLPNRFVDPWSLVNPFRLWLIFALIVGIGFAGYIAVRWMGPGRGLAATGLAAGFVSSTAATLALAQRYRKGEGTAGPLVGAVVLANVASAAAQLVVVAVACGEILPDVALIVGGAIGVGLAGALTVFFLGGEEEAAISLESPIAWRPAAFFALGLGAVLALSTVASRLFGAGGVLVMAVLVGSMDVHAVTLSVSNLAASGAVTPREAVLGILGGFVANMGVKLGLAGWAGGRGFLLRVAIPLLGMVAAAVGAYVLKP